VADAVLTEILGEVHTTEPLILDSYLRGATRDATFNRLHRTTRFAQRDRDWLEVVQASLTRLYRKSWRYREGRRTVWVVETSGEFESLPRSGAEPEEVAAWARGYFDAEGGLPRDANARFYIQICQKNLEDLVVLWRSLESLGIESGRLHNPSPLVDPHYWRFFIRSRSREKFARLIGSWHPAKRLVFDSRYKTGTPDRPSIRRMAI
jgi:LAGLIDADG-like domain